MKLKNEVLNLKTAKPFLKFDLANYRVLYFRRKRRKKKKKLKFSFLILKCGNSFWEMHFYPLEILDIFKKNNKEKPNIFFFFCVLF